MCPECNTNYELRNLNVDNFGIPQLHKSKTAQVLSNLDVQNLQKENKELK